MNNWLSNSLAQNPIAKNGLATKREQSLQLLQSTPWPNRKTELWKYTPLKALENLNLPGIAANAPAGPESIPDLTTLDIIYVDGVLQTLPSDLPEGIAVSDLNAAENSPLAQQLFCSIKPERHYFGLINDVMASNGLVIDVDENFNVELPIRVVNVQNAGSDNHLRLLVNVKAGASLNIMEQSIGSFASVNTLFSEYQLGEKAVLNHYKIADQSGDAIAIAGNHFRLASEARLNSNIVAFGSQLSRLDVDVDHQGENSHAVLNGIYLLDNKELFDLHTNIEHSQPKGLTEETIRGIVGGEGKAVFNGRIHIHPHAQKTEALLNNRNLLLSNRAEVDTKPELEIYADDVRCAHGATVSQIEDKSLYYLQSRGIDLATAKAMLNFGFINELLDQFPHHQVADWLRPQIKQRFDQSSELA